MKKKDLTIDDLLDALKSPIPQSRKFKLENNAETWRRIGERDPKLADDLGLSPGELTDYLREWTEENDYNNI